MNNLFNFIEKNGNKSFNKLAFTEIDNLIFSELSYYNWTDIVSNDNNKITLKEAIEVILNKKGIIDSLNRKKLLKVLKTSSRYKNLELSNYIKVLTDEEQFSAVCIDIDEKLSCISFEGTDNTLVGWKEDFSLSYKDLIPSQIDAIKYLNKVSKGRKRLIVMGHSKGGNLAVISSIYSNLITKFKIINVYSNDGPGLNDNTYNSYKYKMIKKKIIKIIPNNSVIGLLFNVESNLIVVKSPYKGIRCHSMFTWEVNKNSLKREDLCISSLSIRNSFSGWITSYSNEEKEVFCNYLFDTFKSNNIIYTEDLMKLSPKKIEGLFKGIKYMNPSIKKMYKEFFMYIKSVFLNKPDSSNTTK